MDHWSQRMKTRARELGISLKELSERADVSYQSIKQYSSGNVDAPRAGILDRIAKVLEVEKTWLSDGVSTIVDSVDGPLDATVGQFFAVPVYDAAASAGNGTLITQENIVDYIGFKEDWLHRITQGNLGKLAVIRISGDSMEPTLLNGDTVLVDMTITSVKRDAIYVVQTPDGLVVKRITYDPILGKVLLSSDNQKHPQLGPFSPIQVHVLGRVVWLGRSIA